MNQKTTHELKTWPEYFEKVISGKKTFEYRVNDRDFKVGDQLFLMEFDPKELTYSGRKHRTEITYILPIKESNFVILALDLPESIVNIGKFVIHQRGYADKLWLYGEAGDGMGMEQETINELEELLNAFFRKHM